MSGTARDNSLFETKVANLINATKRLNVAQTLVLRRLTLADPESLKWANQRQLEVVFQVILAKSLERMGLDQVREAREREFAPFLTSDPATRAEDLRVLSGVVDQLLGGPPQPSAAHEEALEQHELLARLLALGPTQAGRPVPRNVGNFREPPPLFAAQLGQQFEAARAPEPNHLLAEIAAKPFTDFPTLFDDTLCAYGRAVLKQLQISGAPLRLDRPPFPLSPDFAACYNDVMRRLILPSLHTSRHIQQLSQNHNWAEVGGAKLIEILHAGEVNNPILHNWDNRWQTVLTAKAKKTKPEDDIWQILRQDSTQFQYTPPGEEAARFLQDIIRFEVEAIAKAWRELVQLHDQEFFPGSRQEPAREGAFRDGLMKWNARLPEGIGEYLSIRAYYMLDRADATFLRRLLTNFGRTDTERRRAAPILFDFVQTLGSNTAASGNS